MELEDTKVMLIHPSKTWNKKELQTSWDLKEITDGILIKALTISLCNSP